jgi:hypothetical protein
MGRMPNGSRPAGVDVNRAMSFLRWRGPVGFRDYLRPTFLENGARPCHYPQARAHDGCDVTVTSEPDMLLEYAQAGL